MRVSRWNNVALVLASAIVVGAPAGAQPGRPPMMGAPMMGGGDKPSPKTAALMKKADQLNAQLKKKPSDAKLKLQVAQARYEQGHAQMTDSALAARFKYRMALKAFREALKLNPNHKQAKSEKEMIESIYRQMGRPIPQ